MSRCPVKLSGEAKTFAFSDIEVLLQKTLTFGSSLAADLPAGAGWLPLVVLVVLYVTAMIDAQTGRIPDPPIFLGLLLSVAVVGIMGDWPEASHRLLLGLLAAIALWGVNQAYYRLSGHDALGMGDAKWTALAVTVFGLKPVAMAWAAGAWLALLWIGARWLVFRVRRQGKNKGYVHFSPFLFVGLIGVLYWLYLR